jgi:uncharacterized phiE125 gp8 family phage protein
MRQLLTKISGPVALVVSVNDCKLDLRIDHNEDDLLIESYIMAASELCSEIVGKKLINETWKYSFQTVGFNNVVELPLLPVSSISEIQYYDSDNASQTLTISDFYLFNYDDVAIVEPKLNVTWPATYSRKDAFSISFVAGFGSDSTVVPESVKRAIRLIVAHWYEHRTSASEVNLNEIPYGVHHLLSIDRVGWVA